MQYGGKIVVDEDMPMLNILRIEGCQCTEICLDATTAIVELCIKSKRSDRVLYRLSKYTSNRCERRYM